MTEEIDRALQSDMPLGLDKITRQTLIEAGYRRIDQLAGLSEYELIQFYGVGPGEAAMLRAALAARGLSFADEGYIRGSDGAVEGG